MNEERFSPRPESDDTETKSARDRFESVVNFLRGSREQEDQSLDDDSEEKKEKKKRGKSSKWSGFLRKMFGGGSSERSENADEGEAKTGFRPLISFELVSDDPRQESDLSPGLLERTLQPADSGQGVLSEEQQPVTELTDGNLSVEADTELILPIPQRPAGNHEDAVAQEAPPETPEPSTGQFRRSQEYNSRAAEPEVEDRLDHTHRNPVPGLLALDYLNHRARKKLEKRVKKDEKQQAEKLRKLEGRITERRQAAQKEQEPAAFTARRQQTPPSEQFTPRTSKEQQSNTVSRGELVQPPVTAVEHQKTRNVENPEVVVQLGRIDNAPERDAKSENQAERTETVEAANIREAQNRAIEADQARRHEKKRREQMILEEKEAEAQRRAPVISQELLNQESAFKEKEYERKNEVRDQQNSDFTSVGAVLGSMPRPGPVASKAQNSGATQPRHNAVSLETDTYDKKINHIALDDSQLYKNAVTTGFWSAVVIFAIILTVLILR